MRPGYAELNAASDEAERDPFTEERYAQFARHLPAGARRVLDVGCATGRGGAVLKAEDPALELTGLDIVQARLDRLDPAVYGATLRSPSTAIDAPDGHFDAVLAGEFVEHLYPDDVDVTLRELHRVLRPGGRVLLTTPNPNDLKKRIRRQSVLGGAHVSQHPPRALRDRLRTLGFTDVELVPSGKTTRYLPSWAPLWVFGSYLVRGDRAQHDDAAEGFSEQHAGVGRIGEADEPEAT